MKHEKEKCICRFTRCKRHGDCKACIAHHQKSKKHPLPFCQKKQENNRPD